MALAPGGPSSDVGYRVEIPVPPSPPPRISKTQTAVCARNESVRTVLVSPDVHMGHMGAAIRGEYMGHVGQDPLMMRTRPGTVSGGRPAYLHPRKADVYTQGYHGDPYAIPPTHYSPAASTSNMSPASHQNIDWRTYQTYREYIDNKGLHVYSRTIQERLDSLRAASQSSHSASVCAPPPAWGSKIRRRSTSHDRSYQGPPMLPPRSASQDRMSGVERVSRTRDWPPRSVSSDGIVRKPRIMSSDYIEHGEVVPSMPWPGEWRGYGRVEQGGSRPSRQSLPQRAVLFPHQTGYNDNIRGRAAPHQLSSRTDIPPPAAAAAASERLSRISKNQAKEPPQSKDQRATTAVGNHVSVPASLGQQSRVRAETMQIPETGRETSVGQRSASCSAAPPQRQHAQRTHPQDLKGLPVNGRSPVEGVVLREKPPVGKNAPQPLRHPSYILAVNDTDGAEPAGGGVCWLPNDERREMHMRRLGEHQDSSFCSSNLDESLDSIPFIGKCSLGHHGNATLQQAFTSCRGL